MEWSPLEPAGEPLQSSLILFVKDLHNNIIPLTADAQDTVGSLKLTIQTSRGHAPTTQRLIFRGKELEDASTLMECGLTEGDTVHLVLRDASTALKQKLKSKLLKKQSTPDQDRTPLATVATSNIASTSNVPCSVQVALPVVTPEDVFLTPKTEIISSGGECPGTLFKQETPSTSGVDNDSQWTDFFNSFEACDIQQPAKKIVRTREDKPKPQVKTETRIQTETRLVCIEAPKKRAKAADLSTFTEGEKEDRRMRRNRASAERSRQRRIARMAFLEEEYTKATSLRGEMEAQVVEAEAASALSNERAGAAEAENRQLRAENGELQRKVAELQRQLALLMLQGVTVQAAALSAVQGAHSHSMVSGSGGGALQAEEALASAAAVSA